MHNIYEGYVEPYYSFVAGLSIAKAVIMEEKYWMMIFLQIIVRSNISRAAVLIV
jgi:hypothetical protein